MSERAIQPGDRVEWRSGTRTVYGTVERIGTGKSAGVVMVIEDGDKKSRPVSAKRLRTSVIKMAPAIGGGDAA